MLVYFFDLKRLSKPFDAYSQLEEMLALRKLGWSYTALGDRFSVPKTTIRYLCRRFGLAGNVTVITFRQHSNATSNTSKMLNNEREEMINPGKSYAQYLQEQKDRKWRHLIQSGTSQSRL